MFWGIGPDVTLTFAKCHQGLNIETVLSIMSSRENSTISNPPTSHPHDLWPKLRFRSPTVSMKAFIFSPRTPDFRTLMSQGRSKSLLSDFNPKGAKFQGFQIPVFKALPMLRANELSNLDPGPSQRTQGWNTSARENLTVDLQYAHTRQCG